MFLCAEHDQRTNSPCSGINGRTEGGDASSVSPIGIQTKWDMSVPLGEKPQTGGTQYKTITVLYSLPFYCEHNEYFITEHNHFDFG